MNSADRYPGLWRVLSDRAAVLLARYRRGQAAARTVGAFLRKAFRDNLTGLSAMVAYQLALSLLAVSFVAMFVASRLLQNPELERNFAQSFQRVFPRASAQVITNTLDSIRTITPGFGVAGVLLAFWLAGTLWSSLDTAFSQIYRLPSRSWPRQKLFAAQMVVLMLVFIGVTAFGPFAQTLVQSGAKALPFGIADLKTLTFWLTVALGVVLEFGLLCLIYRLVPNRSVPWRAVWPGALLSTSAITAIAFAFPVYLTFSALSHVATQYALLVISLVWFFALAMAILAGGVTNALRLGVGDRPLKRCRRDEHTS